MVAGDERTPEEKAIDEWLPITSSRTAKWWYSTFHNVTAMVGAGVLSLPYAMSSMGWGPGITMMILSWIITLYTLWQMVEMHEMVPGKRFDRYHELGQHAFGEKLGLYIVVPQQVVVDVSTCIIYMQVLKECAEDDRKDVLLTPAPLGATSRRKATKDDSAVKQVYSVRRSVRLEAKSGNLLQSVANDNSDLSRKALLQGVANDNSDLLRKALLQGVTNNCCSGQQREQRIWKQNSSCTREIEDGERNFRGCPQVGQSQSGSAVQELEGPVNQPDIRQERGKMRLLQGLLYKHCWEINEMFKYGFSTWKECFFNIFSVLFLV